MGKGFDEYAPAYDAWFLENRNVLYSEINLVAHVLKNPGRTLSVGCGSGLFETILAKEYGITITDGIEPSEGMAEIARKRGMKVTISTATTIRFSSTVPPATSPIWKASSAKPTTPCPKAAGSS